MTFLRPCFVSRRDGRIIAGDQQPVAVGAIPQGHTGTLLNISFVVPVNATGYDTVTVKAELVLGDDAWATSWDLGVFPHADAPSECNVPVFASPEVLPATKLQCSNAAPVPEPEELPRTPFVVVAGADGIDEAIAAALHRAGTATSTSF